MISGASTRSVYGLADDTRRSAKPTRPSSIPQKSLACTNKSVGYARNSLTWIWRLSAGRTPLGIASKEVFVVIPKEIERGVVTPAKAGIVISDIIGAVDVEVELEPVKVKVKVKGIGFLVDAIGDVVKADESTIEPLSSNLSEAKGGLPSGVIKTDAGLLVLLDINEVLHGE